MNSPAHNETLPVTEKPRNMYNVHFGERRGNYIPVSVVQPIPDWAFYAPTAWHGEGYLTEGNEEHGKHVLYVNETFGRSGMIPPGDWLIYYRYDLDYGCQDPILCVAARISQ